MTPYLLFGFVSDVETLGLLQPIEPLLRGAQLQQAFIQLSRLVALSVIWNLLFLVPSAINHKGNDMIPFLPSMQSITQALCVAHLLRLGEKKTQ